MRARLSAIGSYLPPRVVTSGEIERRLEVAEDPGWLEHVTGVRTRRFAEPGVTSSQLAIEALRNATKNSMIDLRDVDCLIVGSVCPDFAEPATANVIQDALGLTGAGFDVNNACNGFLTGLQIADSFIRTGAYRRVAIVCGEMISPFIPWHLARGPEIPTEHLGALTLGDGAGAAIVTESRSSQGILAMHFMTDPRYWRAATVLGGGSMYPHDFSKHYFLSDPQPLFQAAEKYVPSLIDRVLSDAGWCRADVDVIVGHQVSVAMTRKLTDLFGKGFDLAINTYSDLGNIAAAGMPVALHEALRRGRLQRGSKLLLVACAAGFAAGVAAVEW